MKILIVDAGFPYKGNPSGTLNHMMTDVARETLEALGHEVKTTRLADGWLETAEKAKYEWLDAVIYQTPAWYMEAPWILKKYEDEVFTQGLSAGDGRHHETPSVGYGTGGVLKGRYMISSTWNAPLAAFTEPGQFFEGRGVDAVFFPLHKANQFIGLTPLPSFMCNDVIKNPTIEADVKRWKEHLTRVFGAAK